VISSATREVVIGFERPFVMIGERINPTGRKILAAEMAAGNFARVEADTHAQIAAGAHMLDVNAGIPLADEPAILAKTIQLVQSITDLPLSIDSSIVAALEEHKPDILGMSALLTTTMPYMKVVIDKMKETGIRNDFIVLVGGAPLNEEFGKAVGADAYCRDAAIAVETAKSLVAARRAAGGGRAATAA
jgi:cobalamin-dependent methionine synthase I